MLDDEAHCAHMLQDLLSLHHYSVDSSTLPERALEQLEEIPYDLVISDYRMPGMDGAAFLKCVRELYPKLPFIFVSGLMNTSDLVKVANLDVSVVLEKPLDLPQFLEQVARFAVPMADGEQTQASHSMRAPASLAAAALPDEPLYMSAQSSLSQALLRDVWMTAQASNYLYLLETSMGEGELIAKDLSRWKGNRDKPIHSFDWQQLSDDFDLKLGGLLADVEKSDVVCIKVGASANLKAVNGWLRASRFAVDEICCLLIASHTELDNFEGVAGLTGFRIPALMQRPSDVSEYIVRFMRLACERIGKRPVIQFSEAAVYALLSHPWSSCREIQSTMTQLACELDVATITLQQLSSFLPAGCQSVPLPSQRLSNYLKQAQHSYLQQIEASHVGSRNEFLKSLELDDMTLSQTADLSQLPLIVAELGDL